MKTALFIGMLISNSIVLIANIVNLILNLRYNRKQEELAKQAIIESYSHEDKILGLNEVEKNG